jgi:hypothetical protein
VRCRAYEQTGQFEGAELAGVQSVASLLRAVVVNVLHHISSVNGRVVKGLRSVGSLQLERKRLVLDGVELELGAQVKLLEGVLHHEVERVVLGELLQLEGVEAVAVDLLLKVQQVLLAEVDARTRRTQSCLSRVDQ